MSDEFFCPNGLDAETGTYLLPPEGILDSATGKYLTPPLNESTLARAAQGKLWEGDELNDLQRRNFAQEAYFGPANDINPHELGETGWGIVFAVDDPRAPAIREALKPLLEHRRQQVAKGQERFFKIYYGKKDSGEAGVDPGGGYQAGDSKSRFLAARGAAPGPADPENVPYYLLLVGDPDKIPFRFQYQLDVQYAVGRLHFDNIEDYARYARSVVQAETGQVARPRQATLFGVCNTDDRATKLSSQQLVGPLAEKLATAAPEWTIKTFLGETARKKRLRQFLNEQAPALLFTASHGMGFPNGHPDQLKHQGALVCQDWPGPINGRGKPITPDYYFSADDLDPKSDYRGMITFHFACFGAGTPQYDDFFKQSFSTPKPIAPRSFLARLPQQLLCHPGGGALAVIGHVERAWGCSFLWSERSFQVQATQVFESTLRQLLKGFRVGNAMEFFNQRYAELSSDLSARLDDINHNETVSEMELARLWTSNNDARSYVVLGDPAVRVKED